MRKRRTSAPRAPANGFALPIAVNDGMHLPSAPLTACDQLSMVPINSDTGASGRSLDVSPHTGSPRALSREWMVILRGTVAFQSQAESETRLATVPSQDETLESMAAAESR